MTTSSSEKDETPAPGNRWSDESPPTHIEREDQRWTWRAQARDWLVLIVMMVIYLAWAAIIYFLEPGIR